MNFVNKTVLVTGSSEGIGAATIKKFAKLGANVIINYVTSKKEADVLCDDLKVKYNTKCLCIKCDISNEEEVKNMIQVIIEEFGNIDILVNNAGIAIDTTYDDKTAKNFRRILDVNLIGTFLVCKYVAPYMLKNNYGKIINISSTNGIDTNYVESLDYDASKAGIISLTKNLAKQYAPTINVNSVAPGWVNTKMNKDIDLNLQNEYKKNILLNRFAEPEEIANVIVFLASEDAKYINSSIIRVDGGELA